ncbi:MAG TPA: ABC transporter permease [Spirochaetota bacterium]|nr:ABC transporter permease [Spirochaetota bacterium]HOL56537.1 ABC transporter permease [Spirochaetota bacterium]HPP03638.1 ABC transporter permease [Spirochaetota bacterium]
MKKIDSLKFNLYSGLRYITQSAKKEKRGFIFFSLFFGVAIGLAVLIVVLSIMNGFQENHISRRIEIGSYHISIFKKNEKFKIKEALKLKEILYNNFKEIEAVVPYADREIIFKTTKKFFSGISEVEIIKLRAIDPEEVIKDSRFNKFFTIQNGKFDLSDYSILIGTELSQRISVIVNMDLYLTPDISLRSAKSEGIPFKIKGLYNTNSYDYDRYWGFISIYSLAAITGNIDIDSIGIKLKDKKLQKRLLLNLKKILGEDYIIEEAEEINKGYFAALKLEKALILFLFIMIFLMVSINTFGALKLTIIEKKIDIAILKALGTTPHDIEIIYLLESIIIGFLGSFFGILIGTFIAYNISNIFNFIELIINVILRYLEYLLAYAIPGISLGKVVIYDSSIYYQTSFLVKVDYFEITLISFLVITMTIVAGYIPIAKASYLKPNEIIRS